eukprot:TRINITY_DN26002_c0_g1_i1.p2 TRINITY_DN26002_c0_g1~~TRINITY_DN26002_c0_g1_i1.p2  ORF type:complete len:485 (+),score=75.39 TRINITY_DN26002_c0_g1_i1:109-1563(+)
MFVVGSRVRLSGLLNKPELNGKLGICKERQSDSGRWTIILDDGGNVALKVANLELLPLPQYGKWNNSTSVTSSSMPVSTPLGGVGFATAQSNAASTGAGGLGARPVSGGGACSSSSSNGAYQTAESVLEGFDKLVPQLETTHSSVCDAMVYCMEHAKEHAAPLARRLAASLGKVGLSTKAALARLFVVSDVLHNAASKRAQNASQFHTIFQELFPETFEKLGRLWLRKLENQVDRDRCEEAVRGVLKAWERRLFFSPAYIKGLECLLFAPMYDISAKEAANEPDERLRQKLSRWFSGMSQAELPYACQQRGLAGRALPTMICRIRLCHFERYWHLTPGSRVYLRGLQSAPHLNNLTGTCERWDFVAVRWKVQLDGGDVKSVKQENLVIDDVVTPADDHGVGRSPVTAVSSPVFVTGSGVPESYQPMDVDGEQNSSIDGEPLSEEELLEITAIEAAATAEEAWSASQSAFRYGVQVSTGTWTQVS